MLTKGWEAEYSRLLGATDVDVFRWSVGGHLGFLADVEKTAPALMPEAVRVVRALLLGLSEHDFQWSIERQTRSTARTQQFVVSDHNGEEVVVGPLDDILIYLHALLVPEKPKNS